jgi:plasmid maintenance system antidote protein VapI
MTENKISEKPMWGRTPEECIDILLQRMTISELARAISVDASAISHARAGRARITHYEKVDKLRSMVA